MLSAEEAGTCGTWLKAHDFCFTLRPVVKPKICTLRAAGRHMRRHMGQHLPPLLDMGWTWRRVRSRCSSAPPMRVAVASSLSYVTGQALVP